MSLARLLAATALIVLPLAGCSDSATGPARPGESSPRMSVSGGPSVSFLSAPQFMASGQHCTWWISVYGGQAPVTVTWTPGGSWDHQFGALEEYASTDEYFVGHPTTTGEYELTVTVTDALGRSMSRTARGPVGLYPNPSYPCDL